MGGTRRAFTGARWEKEVGYCRAIRRGNHVWVTGTVAVDENGAPVAVGDPAGQARRCFDIIENALGQLDASFSDIVRTRMFVTDIEAHHQAFGEVHGERFKGNEPATTMIEVSRFIAPEFLIEIEADAYVEES
ncbi:RidA family protein [Maricaulis sp.]|uniref:RidA family protein n=1 Tax=Maricaulis sp. TaxID=1486257 RepID=UPI0026037D17|nr:RidA family protein [Maricaulis sp.]